jgi:hypothetical protein
MQPLKVHTEYIKQTPIELQGEISWCTTVVEGSDVFLSVDSGGQADQTRAKTLEEWQSEQLDSMHAERTQHTAVKERTALSRPRGTFTETESSRS